MELNLTVRGVISLLIVFAGGFLIGRVQISGAVWPFGPAYVAAAFLNARRINPYIALGGVLTALAASVLEMDNPAFHFTLTALIAVLMIGAQILKIPRRTSTGIFAAAIAYVICTIAFKMSLLLSAVSSLIEMLICMLMILVVNNVVRLATEGNRRKVLKDEEIISVVFLGILAVLGIGTFNVAGIYLRSVVSIYVCLLAAYLQGAGLAAAVSLAMGFACVLGGAEPIYMANIGLCALVAGAMRKLKKPGIIFGFLAADALMTFYINQPATVILPLVDAGIASLGFLLTPRKVMEFLGKYVDANLRRSWEQRLHGKRFQELTIGRLKEMSHVFSNASQVFAATVEKSKCDGIAYMIGGIPEAACADCMFFKTCWDREFADTFGLMQRLYAKYEKRGSITERDLGQAFSKRCLHADKVIRAAKDVFSKFHTNSQWENKVLESRAAVGSQLRGVARVIDSLAKDVQVDIEFKDDIEENLKMQLETAGVSVKEVTAELSNGNMQVNLSLRGCGGRGYCQSKIQDLVSDACGVPMQKVRDIGVCGVRKYCTLRYEQARSFSLLTGVASVPKEGNRVSGDAHSFEGLKDGRYMLLLCDGMGSGEKAHKESGAAVSLMEDFYRANFDDKTILDTINKLLLLSSSDEIYSTMDLCMVNLIDGRARFTKIGAPHSYLVRGDSVKKLAAASLPMGILDEFKPAKYDMQLEDGDIILMFTDGIADLETAEEAVFQNMMDAVELKNAQEIADTILAMALAGYGGRAKDDMTVMVTRVVKNVA